MIIYKVIVADEQGYPRSRFLAHYCDSWAADAVAAGRPGIGFRRCGLNFLLFSGSLLPNNTDRKMGAVRPYSAAWDLAFCALSSQPALIKACCVESSVAPVPSCTPAGTGLEKLLNHVVVSRPCGVPAVLERSTHDLSVDYRQLNREYITIACRKENQKIKDENLNIVTGLRGDQ